jgi:hypothetical protein
MTVEGEEPYLFWGHWVKGQGHRYYKYNFWQQDRFRTITLVLFIGTWPHDFPVEGEEPYLFRGHYHYTVW